MRHKATPAQSAKLIAEDNQVQAELMAGADGTYPKVDRHALRHITDKNHPLYGRELLDPNPMQPAVNLKRPTSLLDTVRDQIRIAKLTALDQLEESDDDADDFDIPDDPADPTSRWENDFVPSLKESKKLRAELEAHITSLQSAVANPIVAAAPGATPPEKGVTPVSAAAPGEPPPALPNQKQTFFGR